MNSGLLLKMKNTPIKSQSKKRSNSLTSTSTTLNSLKILKSSKISSINQFVSNEGALFSLNLDEKNPVIYNHQTLNQSKDKIDKFFTSINNFSKIENSETRNSDTRRKSKGNNI